MNSLTGAGFLPRAAGMGESASVSIRLNCLSCSGTIHMVTLE